MCSAEMKSDVVRVICRYAVPPAEAACHRRRENNHPKPDRPAEVIFARSQYCDRLRDGARLQRFVFCRKDHEEVEFEVHEVYAVDVLISTGEGKVGDDLMQWFKLNKFRRTD